MAKIQVNWPALSYRPFVISDILFPGTLFGQAIPDDRLDYYEVQKQFFEDEDDEWGTTESVTVTQLKIQADNERAGRVRIRAVLRGGEKTVWAYSSWFPLYGFEASFRNYRNNTIILGII